MQERKKEAAHSMHVHPVTPHTHIHTGRPNSRRIREMFGYNYHYCPVCCWCALYLKNSVYRWSFRLSLEMWEGHFFSSSTSRPSSSFSSLFLLSFFCWLALSISRILFPHAYVFITNNFSPFVSVRSQSQNEWVASLEYSIAATVGTCTGISFIQLD